MVDLIQEDVDRGRADVRQASLEFWSKFPWKLFITLTFRDLIAEETAWKDWRFTVRILNSGLLGSHYTHKVGHSYFSYLFGQEMQQRDVIHYHALIDRPIDFELLHKHWNRYYGFAWISIIRDQQKAVEYVTKYALKEDNIRFFIRKRPFIIRDSPAWWLEA